MEGSLVQDSREALCCVPEQDTFSAYSTGLTEEDRKLSQDMSEKLMKGATI